MTDSLAANEDADFDDSLYVEWSRPCSGTLAMRVGGCHLIDISETGHFPTLCPHRKVLLLSLLLSLKDRATELRFEPQDTDLSVPGVRMSYVVGGEVYDLVPPPFEIAIEIIQEIKELAGLPVLRRPTSGIWRGRRLDRESIHRADLRRISYRGRRSSKRDDGDGPAVSARRPGVDANLEG